MEARNIQNGKMLQKKKNTVKCCLVDKKEEDREVVAGLGDCGVVTDIRRTVSGVEAEFK